MTKDDAQDEDQHGRLSDDLYQEFCAVRDLTVAMACSLSETAGRIAQTMDESARVHDEIAESQTGTVAAREHADTARDFAEHERREQQRWSAASRHHVEQASRTTTSTPRKSPSSSASPPATGRP